VADCVAFRKKHEVIANQVRLILQSGGKPRTISGGKPRTKRKNQAGKCKNRSNIGGNQS